MFPSGTKKHKDYNQSGSVVSISSWKEVRDQQVGQYNLIESGVSYPQYVKVHQM